MCVNSTGECYTHLCSQRSHFHWEALAEVPVHDTAKDEFHCVTLKVVDGEGVEMTEEPRGDGVTTSSRWTHGCYQYNVHQVHLRAVRTHTVNIT